MSNFPYPRRLAPRFHTASNPSLLLLASATPRENGSLNFPINGNRNAFASASVAN